ncbi:hypothetical protein Lser_V15G11051 [Lactuca serriola]
MSSSDNYGLPNHFGKSFPYEDDIPRVDRGERSIPSSCIGGTSLPPPPPVILLHPRVHRLEKFKVTQALLASKHQDGKSVYDHVLEMKSQVDRLGMLGVVFPRKLAIDLVLQSLPKSYSQFVKDYYMKYHDMTLIDLTYLLIVVEASMLWHSGQANFSRRSISQTSMDIENRNTGSP